MQVVFAGEGGAKQSGALEVLWSVGFERVSPVRSFGSFRGQRSFQGSWWFATTGEHVGFESWVERDAVMLLDFDPDVIAVSWQPFCLPWANQPRARRHVPDFFARLADGSARQITSWLLRHPDSLDADEQAALARIRARCQHVDSLAPANTEDEPDDVTEPVSRPPRSNNATVPSRITRHAMPGRAISPQTGMLPDPPFQPSRARPAPTGLPSTDVTHRHHR